MNSPAADADRSPEVHSTHADPRQLRRSYDLGELDPGSVAANWQDQLRNWYDQAAADERVIDPNAMQVATVDADGRPDLRTVLVRGFEPAGLVFYTGYDSAKGRQLAGNPVAAAVLSWLPLERQVRLRGTVSKVSRLQTESYFASRPRGSQLATWASPQSQTIAGRPELDRLLAEVTERFGDDDAIPAPPNWGGYLITVEQIEFWQGRQYRLHDRLRFRRDGDGWATEWLAP